MAKCPYSAEILLELIIAPFYISAIKFNDERLTNIVKFHFYASKELATGKQMKIRDASAFDRSVEFVL